MGDDIFESAHELEETHFNEGYEAGIEAGRKEGRLDGKALGIQKGFEIGHEIGFYAGCTQIWRQLGTKNPTFISARAEKAITVFEEQLATFPLTAPKDERLHELIDAVRGRYKAILSMLNLPDTLSSPLSPPPPSTIATQTKLNIQPESLQF